MKNQQAGAAPGKVSPARIFARPTADDLWLGPTQTSALSQLSRPVPVRALLGPPSSGRTTLLRHLARTAGPNVTTLSLSGPERLRKRVLSRLLQSVEQTARGADRDGLREQIDAYVRSQLAQGQRIVLQVDDAEDLGPAAFAELLALRQRHQGAGADIHLLLTLEHLDAGSSPAADFLRDERSPSVAVLAWMNATEISWYLNWRLTRFGLAGLLKPDAIQLIARNTRGCFAAVDHLGQMSLLLLRERAQDAINAALVRDALRKINRPREPLEPVHTDVPDTGAVQPSDPVEVDSIDVVVSRDGEILQRVSCTNRMMIGRSPFNDLHLDDPYLSRHHVAIIRGASGFYLSDLNSMNGVYLNGQLVKAAPISNGDLLRIGPFSLKLIVRESKRLAGPSVAADSLSRTWEMPAPEIPEPARLKLIK